MKIGVFGAGPVGLTYGACFADLGHKVICYDIKKEIIDNLNQGKIHFFEPHLKELVNRGLTKKNLEFTNDPKKTVQKTEVIFICVSTPEKKETGEADLSYVFSAAETISNYINNYKIVVLKSTVPVNTSNLVKEIIQKNTNKKFDVVSNPEFLVEGSAVQNFQRPDRIIIGTDSEEAAKKMKELYRPETLNNAPIIITDNKTAETIKYAANSLLATRISSINEIAEFCEAVGADIRTVSYAARLDPRIGSKYLYPGPGFGGSCFPKDTRAFIHMAKKQNIDLNIIKSTYERNQRQKTIFIPKIEQYFGDLNNIILSIWGLSFKPETSDIRESPSIEIIKTLLDKGAILNVFDPEAIDSTKLELKKYLNKINYCETRDDTLKNSQALIIITDWNMFKQPDFNEIKKQGVKIIFDLRTLYNPSDVLNAGLDYYGIGRGFIK